MNDDQPEQEEPKSVIFSEKNIDRNKIKHEINTIDCKIDTVIYEAEELNEGIIAQLQSNENKPKCEDNNTKEPKADEDTTNNRILPPFFTEENLKLKDDASKQAYKQRIKNLSEKYCYPSEEEAISLDNLWVAADVWNCLFEYQRNGLKWLWDLHRKSAGGILADEMGLGKTVQIVCFLGALHYSDKHFECDFCKKPTLIIATVTILQLWMREIYNWWPFFKVMILHNSGSYAEPPDQFFKKNKNLENSIILTSYSTFLKYTKHFTSIQWNYVILDEGHKIKNPFSNINFSALKLTCKHRLIITGTPIQNNLKELWSLFNFVYPGLLGSLDTFLNEVAYHITRATYSNALPLQIKTGFRCAKMLKAVIEPYILRRTKKEVQVDTRLPKKNERIMYCRLSSTQERLYNSMIQAESFNEVYNENPNCIFKAITQLRKLCNHPSLVVTEKEEPKSKEWTWKKSSKMLVVDCLLHKWKKESHRVLIYSQTVKMLDIIENYAQERGYKFLRLDGGYSTKSRQESIDSFNSDSSIFLFLLTTKVGGIGISLVGADRVILFDPDWNPSVDSQAKERAWRIGQTKDVEIFRLLTSGTIEEKMYNRQIFKQFISNKVLDNPSQMRSNLSFGDVHELFAYNSKSGKDFVIDKVSTKICSKAKKRKYKWRHEDDISSDDNVTPILIDKSKIIHKIRAVDDSHLCFTDKKLIEEEADRLAREAIASLNKDSTGLNGLSLNISQPNPLADEILQGLKSMDHLKDGDSSSKKLAIELKEFLKQKGFSTTREILLKFRPNFDKQLQTSVLRKVLQTIAVFKFVKKHSCKMWVLKKGV